MNYLRLLVPAVLLLALTGCSIQSTQLSTLMNIVRAPSVDTPDISWTLEYGDYRAAVYAVSAPDAIMFSNTLGDYIVFDGWVITDVRIVDKMRFQMSLQTAVAGERTYIRNTIVKRIHRCSPWQRQENGSGLLFKQVCKGLDTYTNSILVDSEGAIAEIDQSVDGRSARIRLVKN